MKIKIQRTMILSVVLFGCVTQSLTLRGERWRRVFENWMLRRIFGPKRDEVTGEWRKLHIEELMICTLHQTHLGDQIQKNDMSRVHRKYEGEERCIQGFGGET